MTTNPLGKTGLSVSRLGLGTAEIGFSYGIGDRPLPTEAEAISFLQKVTELGITMENQKYASESRVSSIILMLL